MIGPYEIVELLGEGGFAEVYSARPQRTHPDARQVALLALKVIKRGMDSREIVARFQAEQRTTQSLSHPGIVQLHEAGFTADGLPYFAMDQVDGLPVTEYCQVVALSLPDRLRLFLPLCDAVQHAHQKGVLHRDLKPSNILVEEGGQGPVPKVIDFGIAKALESDRSGETFVTRLGQVLGTPTYMSPEQAAGNDDADTRSDIYSLGAVLYEMLTGQPPYPAEIWQRLPPGEWSRHLRENEPVPVSTQLKGSGDLDAHTKCSRRDLDQVVRKAMSPFIADRYHSADALAEDLRCWLDDRPISARAPTFGELTWRYLSSHRWQVMVVASLLLGVIATAGIGTVLAIQARRAETVALADRNRALAAEQKASDARARSEHQSYQAAIEVATIHLERGESYLAAARLRATPSDLRGWEWGYLMAAVVQPETVAETGLENAAQLAATPDGAVAAAAANNQLVVMDVKQNRSLYRHTFTGRIERLALSEDGKRLAVIEATHAGEVLHIYRVENKEEWALPLSGRADVAWEPTATGGALLMVSGGDSPTPAPGRLARFDAATGRILNERTITRWKTHRPSLTIGPAGKMAVAENSYKDLEIFSLPDLRVLGVDQQSSGEGVDAVLLDDHRDRLVVSRGSHVYAGSATGSPGRLAGELTIPVESIGVGTAPPKFTPARHLNWLADGRWLASGDALGLVEGAKTQPLPLSNAAALLSLTGGRALVLLRSGRLEIRPELTVRGPGQADKRFFGGEYAEGRAAVFTPDSHRVLFQSWNRSRLEAVPVERDPAEGDPAPVSEFARQPEVEWCALPALLPDGTALVRDGVILVAVPPGGNAAPVPLPHTEGAWSACPSADNSRLAVGVPTGVRLLDGQTHALLREWTLPGGPFRVFVLESRRLHPGAVVAVNRESVLCYLPFEGAPTMLPMPFRVDGYNPAPLACHPDAGLLAGALEGGGWAVYDLRSLPSTPSLRQKEASAPVVSALGFTRKARRLAVATVDHRLTVWDWPQTLPLLTFPLNSTCASIAFSADGGWMASTDYNPSLTLRRAVPRHSGE